MALGPFELVFTSVVSTQMGIDFSYPPDAPETHLRVDLRPEGNHYIALLSPLFQEPIKMFVTITPGLVTLDGSASIGIYADCGRQVLTWEEIRFAVDSTGVPTGSVEASGTREDIGWSNLVYAVTGQGSISPDTRAPTFMLAPGLYSGFSLPWDLMQVIASEPLDGPAFLQALAVAVPNPPPFTLASENAPGAQLGARRANVRLTDWNGLGSAVMFTAAGVADGSGNVSMPWSSQLGVFDLGPAADKLRFDAPMGVIIGEGTNFVDSAMEPLCDTDGCAFPQHLQQWDSDSGIAGRLAAPTIQAVTVRYRMFNNYFGPGQVFAQELRVDLVAPGLAAVSVLLPEVQTTDWITSTIPLPPSFAGATEIGFALLSPDIGSHPCGSPFDMWADMLVDEVAVVP